MSTEIFKDPLAPEALDAYESELRAAVPQLYDDAGSRLHAKEILIPQFRQKITETLRMFEQSRRHPGRLLTPGEIDRVCSAIDAMAQKNRVLLDIECDFKPALKIILEIRAGVREELLNNFYNDCRLIFGQHGVTDAQTLLDKKIHWFLATHFAPYGKGIAFAGIVLNRKIDFIVLNDIKEVAQRLGWKLPEEFPVMGASYYNNTQNVSKDLAGFAATAGIPLDQLTAKPMLKLIAKCSNGESINGNRYLHRAAAALKIGKGERLRESEVLIALKRKIGAHQELEKPMDTTYFTDAENVGSDLKKYAASIQSSVGDIKPSFISGIEIICANGQTVKGQTYIRRAAHALGLTSDADQKAFKPRDVMKRLHQIIGIDNDDPQSMDANYFSKANTVRADLRAYAAPSKTKLKNLSTTHFDHTNKQRCSNGEVVSSRTYLIRAGVALGLAQNTVGASTKPKEILNTLKKISGLEVKNFTQMDKTYFEDVENIKADLAAFAEQQGTSVEKLSTATMRGSQKIKCANGEMFRGYTYLMRAAVALGFGPTWFRARAKGAVTILFLKRRIGIEVDEHAPMNKGYFNNVDNIRADLTAYADAMGVANIEEINLKNINPVIAICMNGEAVRGGTYLNRATIGLGLVINTAHAGGKTLKALNLMKKKVGIDVKEYEPMDKAYFENVRTVRHDLTS